MLFGDWNQGHQMVYVLLIRRDPAIISFLDDETLQSYGAS